MKRHQVLYRAAQLPVFQNRMFHSRKEAIDCVKGDVVLVRDMETGLIFNQAFHPELMQYDTDYQNEQAVSSVFRSHLEEVSNIVAKHFGQKTLIEVGCGKGYFLEHLSASGFEITGLDPTYEGSNVQILKEYFTPSTGLSADGIILRHVLEHVQNPVEFLKTISNTNKGQGKIYIEVPCFDWICDKRAWFDVFYEHVNYFRIIDFQQIFGSVYETGRLFGDQYLYVVADLSSLRTPFFPVADDFAFPADFLATATKYAGIIENERSTGPEKRNSVIWGGSSKGVIFALFMQRAGVDVDYVVDINPAKQGKHLAATGLKVISPDQLLVKAEPGSTIFVMNGNYLAEIRQMTLNRFKYVTVDHENL